MKKWNILILLVFLATSVYANPDMCDDMPTAQETCLMVTPTINCTGDLDYKIFQENGTRIVFNNLTQFNNETSIYMFNFTQTAGDYIVKLCDGTTREVFVGQRDKNMAWISIILSLGIMMTLFMVGSFSIKNPMLNGLKALLFLLSLIFASVLGIMPFVITNNVGNPGAFLPVATGIFSIMMIMMIIIVWFYGKFLMEQGLDVINGGKDNNE